MKESTAHMRARIAAEYGVQSDADLITGDDENRMRRQAERLQQRAENHLEAFARDTFGRPSTRVIPTDDTTPGRPVAATEGGEPSPASDPMRDVVRTVFQRSDLD